jgi:hypothetical protein
VLPALGKIGLKLHEFKLKGSHLIGCLLIFQKITENLQENGNRY